MDGGWNEIVDPGNRYNSPNFSAGRPEPYHQITHIIVHICGSFEGARDRFLTVDEAATHYVIKDDGTITQFIQDINRGWHAGILEGQYTFRGVRYNSIVVTNQTSVIQPYKVHEKNLYERATDEWKRWRLGWPRRLNGLWEYYYVANPSDIYNWDMVYPGYDKPFNYLINPYPNNYSIGIELVGGTFYTEEDYTYRSAQIDGLVKLLKDLIRKYSIPVTREFLVGHEDVNPIARFRWDPGPGFNWDDILVRVKPQIAYPLQ